MIDIVSAAQSAISMRTAWSPLLVGVCGFVAAAGPCAAPRFAVFAALTQTSSRRGNALGIAFIAGTCLCYAGIAYVAASLGHAFVASPHVYVVVSVILIAAGLRDVITAELKTCSHAGSASLGASFIAGGASAAMLSPCCTALIVPIVLGASQNGRPLDAALLAGAFALGHSIPSAALLPLARVFRVESWNARFAGAGRVVCGSVLVGTGLVYGLLA
jgi:cytochrome c biogenesis protein CcdA